MPVSEELVPTATLPKLSVEGDTANDPVVGGGGGWVFDPAETPAHPARTSTELNAARVQKGRHRELIVLSIPRLSGPNKPPVESANSHGLRSGLNCTSVIDRLLSWEAGQTSSPFRGC